MGMRGMCLKCRKVVLQCISVVAPCICKSNKLPEGRDMRDVPIFSLLQLPFLGDTVLREMLENAVVGTFESAVAKKTRRFAGGLLETVSAEMIRTAKEVWDSMEASGAMDSLSTSLTSNLLSALDVNVARKEAELAADAAEANKGCATRTYEKVFGAAEEHAAPQELELKDAASQPLPGHRLGAHKPVVEQVCT